MPDKAYHFGLLLVVFGGFLMLGRDLFAADSHSFGMFGLVIMVLGIVAAGGGLMDSPASES